MDAMNNTTTATAAVTATAYAAAGLNGRVDIYKADSELTPMAGCHVLTLKRNDKGFPGAVFRAPVIGKAHVWELLQTQGPDCALLALLVDAVTQGQRDKVRAAILNGTEPGMGSIGQTELELPAIVEFMQSSGAAGFRFTKEVFEAISPLVRQAVFAFYLERRPAVAGLSPAEQLGAATPTINKYMALLNTLYVTRAAKEEAQKAVFAPTDAENLVAILAMAAVRAEAETPELSAAIAGVGRMAEEAMSRATSADLI